MHLYDLRRVLCQDNSLAERFEITNHLLRFDFPRYLAGIAGIVTRTPSRVCIYTVYFINRQGLGPTLSPRLESAFAWTAIVWSHSLRYISPRFLSYSTSCVSLTLQPEWQRIPAVTRAARTMPLPFMDRLEYRCSNGNVTCKGQLTANYNLLDYVTRDRVSVNRSTSYSLVNID